MISKPAVIAVCLSALTGIAGVVYRQDGKPIATR
jgi:hypothetical protein